MQENLSGCPENECSDAKESKKDDPMLVQGSESQLLTEQAKSTDVFDSMEFWDRVGGDPEVFGRLLDLFGCHAPEYFAKLKAAFDAGDAGSVRSEAHSLKGAAANMSAHNAARLAGQIEHAAVQEDLESAGPLLLELDQELLILQQELVSQKLAASSRGERTESCAY
jgi:HPt (histidine-containing phosphotransfer) domain-containing protein